jgi:glycosyltransferase involved in cell wall biosynthesis
MKLLWIGTVWPEPDASAAGSRTVRLLEVCQDAGYEVRFVSPCQENPHQHALESRGIRTAQLLPNDSAFDSYISEYKPDIVCFDRFMIEEQFSWRVREQVPNALRVLDTVDLHSLRRERQRSLVSGDQPYSTGLSEDTLRELASIYRSDLSLIISPVEESLLRERFGVPISLLEVTGFLYPDPVPFRSYQERANLVFIGNGLHAPNVDAVRLLKNSLWKPLRAALAERGASDVELHIYGAYLPQEILQFDNPRERFRVLGKADNVGETLQRYRCNLAPLRFGAGLKGKVSDGWMVGTPCIATPIATEGMVREEVFGGLIVESLDEYPQRVSELYTDEDAWNTAQDKGRELIVELFSQSKNARVFQERLARLTEEGLQHREQNIVGSILWYQGMRSTEYFSRWIAAKNQRL